VHAVEAVHARGLAEVGCLAAGVHRAAEDVAQEHPGVLAELRAGKRLVADIAHPTDPVVAHRPEKAEIDVAIQGQR